MKIHTQKLYILNAFIKSDRKILLSLNTEVEDITPTIKAWIRNIHYTLDKSNNGVGLAAPQVGLNKRIFVIHYSGSYMTVINPVILMRGGESTENEGCLSVPGIITPILRWETIRVAYTNEKGERFEDVRIDGFLARIFQHEYDHLEGILILDFAEGGGMVI